MELVCLLETFLETTKSNSVIMSNKIVKNIITYLQVMQTKILLLKTQTQFLQDELQQKNLQRYKLVVVHNKPLFEDDDNGGYDHEDNDFNKKFAHDTTSKVVFNKDQLQLENSKAQSDTTSISECE